MAAEDWGFGGWASDPQEQHFFRKRLQTFTQDRQEIMWNGDIKILEPGSQASWNVGKKLWNGNKYFWGRIGEIRARTDFFSDSLL